MSKRSAIAGDDPRLKGIVERLRGGSSSLIKESQALGFTRNDPLRAALRQYLGRNMYDALMTGRPGRRVEEPAR